MARNVNKRTANNSLVLTALTVAVIIGGVAVGVASAARQAQLSEHAWLAMIALALLVAPVSSVRIPGVKANVVFGDTVTFVCAILFGPSAAVFASIADGAIASMRATKSTKKICYNVATCTISMAASGFLTRSLFSHFGERGATPPLLYVFTEVGLFTLCYFLMSTTLIASYIAVATRQPLFSLWRRKFLWTVVSYLASSVSAIGAFYLADSLGYYVFLLVIGIMLTAFLYYRTYFERFKEGFGRQSAEVS
jgi:hypothetical protein